MTVFRDITFLAAGPTSERCRSSKKTTLQVRDCALPLYGAGNCEDRARPVAVVTPTAETNRRTLGGIGDE
jgi:hypothetical protein